MKGPGTISPKNYLVKKTYLVSTQIIIMPIMSSDFNIFQINFFVSKQHNQKR